MPQRVAPNLFIVGSPKCGTSSLHAWLAQVPEIAQGKYKELRFVLDPGNPLTRPVNYHSDGLGGWLSYYSPADIADAPFLLDSTPEYQRQRTALKVIGGLDPKPHVILVFRKPSERIYSLYQFAKYHQGALGSEETFPSFVAEVANGGGRFAGHPMLINAFSETLYADIADEWVAAVGADRVKVLLLEDIERDPKGQIAGVLAWIGLDPAKADAIVFEVHNKTANVRWPRLRHAVGRIAANVPAIRKLAPLRKLYRKVTLGSVQGDEYTASAAERGALDQRFADTIERLSAYTETSAWKVRSA